MEPGLYREIVESSSDGIWVFDLDGRTIYANPVIAAMFGTSQEEFCRLSVVDTLDDVGSRQFAEHLEQLRKGQVNDHDVEVHFVRGDRTSFWALVGESVLRDEAGEVTAVLHRFADYDDRRRVVEALTESRRQLAEGQRIARIGMWEWDVRSGLITGSEGLSALYGLPDDYFPASYEQIVGAVHEDDRELATDAVAKALAGADSFEFTARISGTDGTWVWTRGRGVVGRDEDGEPLTVTGTFQDIGETKLAEIALEDQIAQNALLKAVASAANDARTLDEVLDQGRHLVLLHDDWSRARSFSVTADGRLRPHYVSEADRVEDERRPAETARDLALATESLHGRTQVWDDDRLTIAFPVLYDDEVHAVITITSDPPLRRHDLVESMVGQVALQLSRVIEREHAERAVAAARDAAVDASRQKSDFLATMSHEIRTPLNGVIGLNDLLLRTPLDPHQLQLSTGVQVAGRTLLGLINDILDFSRIEAGKLQLEDLDFAVRPLFDQVVNVLGETARAKGLDLLVSCAPDVPEVLSGDATRLVQVLVNLGSNAVKFTDAGQVRIHATAEPADDRVRLRVEVTDTGSGIDLDSVGNLFEMFTQADASTTRVHGGSGLGLAICREIAHALGGEVGVDSEPGRGSTFWFEADYGRPVGPATDPDDDTARAHLAGARVLIAGDDVRGRVLTELLAPWGVAPQLVGSAPEVESALSAPYDLVLLDLSLTGPRNNGLSLARWIRSHARLDDMPVLLLADTNDLDAEFVRECGIDELLVTPLATGGLREVLLRHLAPEPADAPASPPPVPGSRHRILVVEDNPVNQMVAVGFLEALGYAADVAEDGVVALEKLAREAFDLVLMDVQMPRLDGYATTRALRERTANGRRVPVVAMTAAAVEGERERCLEAGMDDFLTKPVHLERLSTTLASWLGTEATTPVIEDAGTGPAVAELDVDRLDMLRDMGEGDTTYLDRAIGNFVANTPESLATIRAAVTADDVPSLQFAAHRLAGSASNLGVVEVGSAARALEHLADAGTTGGADVLLSNLVAAVDRGRDALLAYQAAYRS